MSGCEMGSLTMRNITQKIDLNIKSDCSQTSEKNAAIDTAMESNSQTFMDLVNASSNKTMSTAASEAKSTMGIGIGNSSSDSEVINHVLNDTKNTTKVKTENVMNQEMETTDIYDSVSKCFSDVTTSNQINLSRCKIVGDAIIENVEQATLGTITANCMAKSDTFKKATKKFITSMGAKVVADNITSSDTTADSKSKGTSTTGIGASGSASLMGCSVLLVAVCGVSMLMGKE
jgi:hypothetical protein